MRVIDFLARFLLRTRRALDEQVFAKEINYAVDGQDEDDDETRPSFISLYRAALASPGDLTYRPGLLGHARAIAPIAGEPPDPDPEVLLRVAVYSADFKDRKMQEFDVLGSQSLSALRDRIVCPRDHGINGA